MKTKLLFMLFSLIFLTFSTSNAANYTYYSDFATFQSALGGASLTTQDFESYSYGDNLNGVEFIPGVHVTSNMSSIQAVTSSGDTVLFGIGRIALIQAYYDINISTHNAVSFYIDSWETNPPDPGGAVGPGLMEAFFDDFTSMSMNLNQPLSLDPVFFGLIADVPIDRIRWSEPLEVSGLNEETTLDNFAVAQVPEPSTFLLLGAGLAGVGLLRRKFRK